MPRFYFDYNLNGHIAVDNVGTVLPSLRAAKTEAAIAAAEWMKDHVTAQGTELKLSVRDGQTSPLFIVTASVQLDPPVG